MDRIKEKLSAVGDAIREKTGKNELFSLDEMPAEIAAIETGIKTDDANATAGDILSGKTAYVKDVKVTGTMPTATQATPTISVSSAGLITASSTQTAGYVAAGTKSATKQLTTKAAATITPSTSNQTIAAGTYLSGAQTIAGDADLKSANIKKGVNIFGVAGSYEGVELNFTVVGGTTQPSSATENTIWVNTSTAITSWVFSATQPSNPTEGMVWITTDKFSSAPFNALKENTLQVYPIIVRQYIGGAWVDKTSMSYQGGAWIPWWNGELYDAGNEYEEYTGGWERNTGIKVGSSAGDNTGTVQKNANSMYFATGSNSAVVTTKKKINLTNYKTLRIEGSGSGFYGVHQYTSGVLSESAPVQGWTSTGNINISALNGEYYVSIGTYQSRTYTCTKIKLEV